MNSCLDQMIDRIFDLTYQGVSVSAIGRSGEREIVVSETC